jgi:hypothetical protein
VRRDGFLDQRIDGAALRIHRQVPGLDGRQVEEITYEAIHALRRTLDHLDLFAGAHSLFRPQKGGRAQKNGAQWISEIVRNDGEKILAGLACSLCLFVKVRVVHRDGSAATNFLGEGQIALGISMSRLSRNERERGNRSAAGVEGYDHDGLHPEPL